MNALSPEEQECHEGVGSAAHGACAGIWDVASQSEKLESRARNGQGCDEAGAPRGKASVDLEVWAIEKDQSYFREVFGGSFP